MNLLIVPVVIKAILKNYIGKMARFTRILHIPNAYLLIYGAITGQALGVRCHGFRVVSSFQTHTGKAAVVSIMGLGPTGRKA